MRNRFASRVVGMLPLLLLLGSSCSLVYDLSPDQCGLDTDCARFGPGHVCSAGICVCIDAESCTPGPVAGTGGDGGTGGEGVGGATGGVGGTIAGNAGNPDTGGVGGASGGVGGATGGKGGVGGATGGKGGKGGTSGDAGMAGAPECETNADCKAIDPTRYAIDPQVCLNQTCIPLKTDECPVILPLSEEDAKWNMLLSADPIILGGFAKSPSAQLSEFTLNYDLALEELKTTINGGINVGSGTRHPVMMVVCHPFYTLQSDLLVPARHLIEDLGVKGIVAQLYIQDQEYLFDALGTKAKNDVFFLMTRYSNEQLINLPDDGLVWHMLSGANALSVSMQPLLDNIETHLRNLGTVGSSEDMRVLLLNANDEPFLADLGAHVIDAITFNGGQHASDQVGTAFEVANVTSFLTDEDPNQKDADAVTEILAFKPHVIIGATANELPRKILPLIEEGWDAETSGQDRPFYLMSPLNYNEAQMPDIMIADNGAAPRGSAASGKVPLYQRILGFNWPAAADPTLYKAYQIRFNAAYQGYDSSGLENYYDAAYDLIYSVAASTLPLTGTKIAQGMLRITDTASPKINVGPGSAMTNGISTLTAQAMNKIELIGAMGPPTWDSFGGRNDPGSVWCLDSAGNYHPDVQRYDPETMGLECKYPGANTCQTPTSLPNLPNNPSLPLCFTFPAP